MGYYTYQKHLITCPIVDYCPKLNDLPEVVSSMLYMFADDTKLYHPIKCPQDHLILEQDLDNLVD